MNFFFSVNNDIAIFFHVPYYDLFLHFSLFVYLYSQETEALTAAYLPKRRPYTGRHFRPTNPHARVSLTRRRGKSSRAHLRRRVL